MVVSLAVAGSALSAGAPVTNATPVELVANGGFEATPVSAGHATTFDDITAGNAPANFGWSVGGNSVDLIEGLWVPHSGSQSLDLDGNAPGEIQQPLATTAGQPYTLTFAYSANPDRLTNENCLNTKTGASMVVGWGPTIKLGTFTFSDANSRNAMGWKTATVNIPGGDTTTESTTLSFTSSDSASACGIALDDISVTAAASDPCTPGTGQVTLFTGTDYSGQCAVYPIGVYGDVSRGGTAIPNNSAESILLGSGAAAVLHGVPNFGNWCCNDAWVNVAASDGNLTDKDYRITSSENGATNAFASVSALWVMPTDCKPSAHQVSLFALPNFGGGCVTLSTGSYSPVFDSGIPNDWASSIKVGSRVSATLSRDVGFGGGSCTEKASDTGICAAVFFPNVEAGPALPQLSALTVDDLPATSATLTLASARVLPGGASVSGTLHGDPTTTYPLSFFDDPSSCVDNLGGTALGTTSVTTDSSGNASFGLTLPTPSPLPVPSKVSVTTVLPGYAPTSPQPPACVDATQDGNTAWTTAETISSDQTVNEAVNFAGEARWSKIPITPGGTIDVSLTGLPANYDLSLFTDINQAFNATSTDGVTQVSAELGSQFSPAGFSPAGFSPAGFSPAGFSPAGFSPAGFSPAGFSPAGFSPAGFSSDAFGPAGFSSSSPDAAYESAMWRSLFGLSYNDGTADEHIFANVFNNTGFFYIAVGGRNGAFLPGANFTLKVHTDAGACAGVNPIPSPTYTVPGNGYQTLILTDWTRLSHTFPALDVAALQSRVGALATATNGTVADVSAMGTVVNQLNAQADALGNVGCPYAKNLVAGAIKDIVGAYRAANPNLKYIVIVGDDHIIPFFRYPDTAGLGPELTYVPPVQATSASQASLQSNDVLSQDEYGSTKTLRVTGVNLPLPDLPVGRLVETPSEITTMINAYLGLTNGTVPTPHSSLVTGYDFMASGANSVETDFSAGMAGTGATNDTLISNPPTPPSQSWTADQLRTQLLGARHDLIYLGGHFSANNTLAADYTTTLNATELASSTVNLTNAIVMSGGCHSGYDIVNGDAIPGVTQPLDWTEAFAQHGATLIAGTGYQYGDTDFLAYSQKLYAGVARAFRYGSGPVAVGSALVNAKKDYLASEQSLQGIDVKALLESTLYGLPMLSVNLPSGRNLAPPGGTSVVTSTTAEPNPGGALGLSSFDYTTPTPTNTNHVTLHDTTNNNAPIQATYLTGSNGVVTSPGAPALPLQTADVDGPAGTVLRGVGFRGGSFSDQSGITPLVGTPATELGGLHPPFVSSIFYPGRLWSVNYYGSLTGNGGPGTQLMLTPAQYMSDGPSSLTDVQRTFSSLTVRLYYSSNTTNVALVAPPTISRVDVSSAPDGTGTFTVTFQVHVVGDPAAGMQEVWVTDTGEHAGLWESHDLDQSHTDTTLWTGTAGGLTAAQVSALRFVVQATNGAGLVSLDDNQGAYYSVGGIAAALQTPLAPTTVTLSSPPPSGPYGSSVGVTAKLAGATQLAGQKIRFAIGSSTVTAQTDGTGTATAQVPLTDIPGGYQLSAAFDGDANDQGSSDKSSFTIDKLPTSLALAQTGVVIVGLDSGVVATLTSGGQPVSQKTVAFLLTPGSGSPVVQTRITDGTGRATLGPVSNLPVGTYTVQAFFGPGGPANVPLPNDPLYASSSSPSPSSVHVTVNPISPSSIGSLTAQFVQGSQAWASANAGQRNAITQQVQNMTRNQLSQIANGPPSSRKAQLSVYKNFLTSLQNSGWLTPAQASLLYGLATQL